MLYNFIASFCKRKRQTIKKIHYQRNYKNYCCFLIPFVWAERFLLCFDDAFFCLRGPESMLTSQTAQPDHELFVQKRPVV